MRLVSFTITRILMVSFLAITTTYTQNFLGVLSPWHVCSWGTTSLFLSTPFVENTVSLRKRLRIICSEENIGEIFQDRNEYKLEMEPATR